MIFLKENIVSDMRTLQKAVRHNFGPGFKKFRDCCMPTTNDPVPTAR